MLLTASLLTALQLLAAEPAYVAPAAQTDAAARKAVESTELAFAAAVRNHDTAAFAALVDEHAVFVSGGEIVRGKAAVVADWASLLAPDAPYFEWHPEVVELDSTGTLGLSRGPWTMRGKNKDGQEVERHGLYNSIWRKQPDGTWKIIFDMGCPVCATCPPAK